MVDIEEEFPILENRIFFNHAAVAPLPLRTVRALRIWTEQAQVSVAEDWPRWAASLRRARSNAAALLHCSTDEIAFIHNTTHGLLCVANSLPWRPGDNILTAAHEFPANVYPWRSLAARGVTTRFVPESNGKFAVDDFAKQVDGRTRLISISLVQYSTGFRMPVEAISELCKQHGILLCIDAIQGLGAMPVDVSALGCDFLAADGHKWLLSAEGFGIFYVKKSILGELNQSMTGWLGRPEPGDFDDLDQPIVPSAKRFEEGSHCLSMAIALEQSTGLLLEMGEAEIWTRIQDLTGRLAEGLLSAGFELVSSRRSGETSGIVAVRREAMDPKAWVKALEERKIFVAARRGYLRFSPHFYNTADQVDALLDALRDCRSHA